MPETEMKVQPPKEDERLNAPTPEDIQQTYGSTVRVVEGAPPPEGQATAPGAATAPPAEPEEPVPDFGGIAKEFEIPVELEPAAPAEPKGVDAAAMLEALDRKYAERETRQNEAIARTLGQLRQAESEYEDAETTKAAKAAESRIEELQNQLGEQNKQLQALSGQVTEAKEREQAREERERIREYDRQIDHARQLAKKLSDGCGKDPFNRAWVLPETIEKQFDDALKSDPQLRNLTLDQAAFRTMPKIAETLFAGTVETRKQMRALKQPARMADAAQGAASPPSQPPVVQGPPPSAGAPAGTQGVEYDITTPESRKAYWDDLWKRKGATD